MSTSQAARSTSEIIPVILTVYFSGSNQRIDQTETLAGLLYGHTQHDHQNQLTRGFDGCGIVSGDFLGGIFGVGLKGQCREVVRQIQQLNKNRKKVILNCYGHSRGGIAALLLTKMLADFDNNLVEINLVLLDPVPGNFLITTQIDFLDITLTNQAMDLSNCKNLKKVLALYPYEPLPDYIAHAPLFPTYPENCKVEEEVILGCHSGAQFQDSRPSEIVFNELAPLITFLRVKDFLSTCETMFDFRAKKIIFKDRSAPRKDFTEKAEFSNTLLSELYKVAATCFSDNKMRISHSNRQLQIVTREVRADEDAYLNFHHQTFCPNAKQSMPVDKKYEDCILSIKPTPGIIASIKRNPYLYGPIKWLTISTGIATYLYLSGGLGAISYVAPYVAKLGAWSIGVATPLIGAAASIVLDWIIKPITNKAMQLCCICQRDDEGYSPTPPDSKSAA